MSLSGDRVAGQRGNDRTVLAVLLPDVTHDSHCIEFMSSILINHFRGVNPPRKRVYVVGRLDLMKEVELK